MPTMASHTATIMPIIREEDILVLQGILEGKPACGGSHWFGYSQRITTRFGLRLAGLLRASRAAGDPDLHLRHGVRSRKRRQRTSVAWVPAPTYKIIVSDVI